MSSRVLGGYRRRPAGRVFVAGLVSAASLPLCAQHCQRCPLRKRCTPNPARGRSISRGEHEKLIEALRARMETEEAKALYRLRSQTVELVNADWKEHRQLRRFSGRGLWRARIQVGLIVLAHNLRTLLSEENKVAATKPSTTAG